MPRRVSRPPQCGGWASSSRSRGDEILCVPVQQRERGLPTSSCGASTRSGLSARRASDGMVISTDLVRKQALAVIAHRYATASRPVLLPRRAQSEPVRERMETPRYPTFPPPPLRPPPPPPPAAFGRGSQPRFAAQGGISMLVTSRTDRTEYESVELRDSPLVSYDDAFRREARCRECGAVCPTLERSSRSSVWTPARRRSTTVLRETIRRASSEERRTAGVEGRLT
jgi:hypothetical protein